MTPFELLKDAPTPRTDTLYRRVSVGKSLAYDHAQGLERESAALQEALKEWQALYCEFIQRFVGHAHLESNGLAARTDALLAALEKE